MISKPTIKNTINTHQQRVDTNLSAKNLFTGLNREWHEQSNAFVSRLKENLGDDFAVQPEEYTGAPALLEKSIKALFVMTCEIHKKQKRMTGGNAMDVHILDVVEKSFEREGFSLLDVLTRLTHDFVEDHVSLDDSSGSYQERTSTYIQRRTSILSVIAAMFPGTLGEKLARSCEILSKYPYEWYVSESEKRILDTLSGDEEKLTAHWKNNKKARGLTRSQRYYDRMASQDQQDLDYLISTKCDDVHSNLSIESLAGMSEGKVKKSVDEKRDVLLPLLRKLGFNDEGDRLENQIDLVEKNVRDGLFC